MIIINFSFYKSSIIGVNTNNIYMRKAVDLLPGDIVWVPSSISNRTK